MAKKRSRKYHASASASFTDVEAQIIGELIEERGGELSPRELVEYARKKNSPLHPLFEWDESKAAEAYRVSQASGHLRMVKITVVKDGVTHTPRACYSVTVNDDDDGARRTNASYDRVKGSPDLARQVIARASGEIKAWRHRYASYSKVFEDVFNAVDRLEN